MHSTDGAMSRPGRRTPLTIDALFQPTPLTCLMMRLKPSVRALVICSVRATAMAGHQVSIVVTSRVVSGMSARGQAS